MKRILALFIGIVLGIQCVIPIGIKAEPNDSVTYETITAEFSDSVGTTENINVMVADNHVYGNAEELATRLGYQINTSDESFVTIFNKDNSDLPYSLTQFFYNDTNVKHSLFTRVLDSYEAPFESIHNEQGIWIPLEYSLLMLNSGEMVVEDTMLIDMPEKKITDLYMDIMKANNTYLFDWGKDFGYTKTDVGIIGSSSHYVNQFNGLLEMDGDSWVQLIQTLALDSSSYDSKYGEDIAMLLCTESNGELKWIQEEAEKNQDLFSEDGKIGKLLSTYSESLDTDAEAMYETCNRVWEDLKSGNSNLAIYNRSYDALEKAFDKKTWFSKTGQHILDVQGEVSKELPLLDIGAKIAEVAQYGNEFQNQDKFSLDALDCFLSTSSEGTISSEAMKKSMREYSNELKSNVVIYSATKYFKENVDAWIGDAIKDGKLLGSQANMALLAWELAADYIPFISNGLSAADKFELALYASVLQSDTFLNYQSYRNDTFADKNITSDKLYELSKYCYIYLKTCYITRGAAIASLDGKTESVKEQLKPLIEEQNNINDSIAGILLKLKDVKPENEKLIYGFLPSDNEEYLKKYNDEKILTLVKGSSSKKERYKAYAEKIKEYEALYGVAKENMEREWYSFISGLSFIKLVDFEHNSQEDLLLVYRTNVTTDYGTTYDTYKFELWGFQDNGITMLDTGELFGFDGGLTFVYLTEYEGKTYLVTGSSDDFGYFYYHGYANGKFGVVREVIWEESANGKIESKINGEPVSFATLQKDEEKWLKNLEIYDLNHDCNIILKQNEETKQTILGN